MHLTGYFDVLLVSGCLIQLFQIVIYYLGWSARKNRDPNLQSKVCGYLKIILFGSIIWIVLLLLRMHQEYKEVIEHTTTTDINGTPSEKNDISQGIFASFAILASVYCLFDFAIPLFIYRQSKKIQVLLERRAELLIQLGVRMSVYSGPVEI